MRSEPVLIAHVDGDSFFVSCELLRKPGLRGTPVVTGGERGVVTSMSIEAKRLGVPRGMPCFLLRRAYPDVVILSSDMDLYRVMAKRVYSIMRRFSTELEEYSIDECFAIVPDVASAYAAKLALEAETGLSFGVGVAANKTLAKVTSRLAKPGSFKAMVSPDPMDFVANDVYVEREASLADMAVDRVWGIGPSISSTLRAAGVMTALDLARADERWVGATFSSHVAATAAELRGEFVLRLEHDAPGRFFTRFSTVAGPRRSIRSSESFHPVSNDPAFLFAEVVRHLDDACARARAAGLAARRVCVFLKTKEFMYTTGESACEPPSASSVGTAAAARAAFVHAFEPRARYRTVGVELRDLVDRGVSQETLFDDPEVRERRRRVEAIGDAIDAVRRRHGPEAVVMGSTVARPAPSKTDGKRRVRAVDRTPKPVHPWGIAHLGDVR